MFRLGFPNGFSPMSNTAFASIYRKLVAELDSRIDGNLTLSTQ